MPDPSRWSRINSVIFSRPAALAAAFVTLLIFLGCTSIPTHEADVYVLVQTDSLDVPAGHELEVYFAAPFASPPNLVIDDSHGDCVVTEQKENYFRVRNKNASVSRSIRWTARGQRGSGPTGPGKSYWKDETAPGGGAGARIDLHPNWWKDEAPRPDLPSPAAKLVPPQ
jgi:hypothetical protein